MRQTEAMSAGTPALQAKALAGAPATVSGAGTTATDATVTGAANILINGGAGSSGVRLLAASPGDVINVKNESGQTILLYPPTGATINTTTSLSMATAKSVTVFFSSSTACHSIPTVAS